jgi:hypothetical protein
MDAFVEKSIRSIAREKIIHSQSNLAKSDSSALAYHFEIGLIAWSKLAYKYLCCSMSTATKC